MKTKSIVIDVSTLKGFKCAEHLQIKGYQRFPSGYTITIAGEDKLKSAFYRCFYQQRKGKQNKAVK